MANKILLNLLAMIAATTVDGETYKFFSSRLVRNSRKVPALSEYSSSLLSSRPSRLAAANANLIPSQCKSYSRQGLQYTWCSNSPPYNSQQGSSYGTHLLSYNPQPPSHDALLSSYGGQLEFDNMQSPTYDARLTSYGDQLIPYDLQSSSYDVQLPSHDSQSSSLGAQLPPYDSQSSSFSAQPPSHDRQPSSYGAQLVTYDSQPSSYSAQLPSHNSKPSSYGAQLVSYDLQPSSYGPQLPSHDSLPSSYGAQLISYDLPPLSYGPQLPSHDSQSSSYGAQLVSYDLPPSSYGPQLPSHDSQTSFYDVLIPFYGPQYTEDYRPQLSSNRPEYESQYNNGLSQLPGPLRPNYEAQNLYRPYRPSSVSHHHQQSLGTRPYNYDHNPDYPLESFNDNPSNGLHQYNYNQKAKYPLVPFNDDQDHRDGEEPYKKYDSGEKTSVSDSFNKYENSGLQINNVAPYPSGPGLHVKSISYPSYKSRSSTPLALLIALPRRENGELTPVAREGRAYIPEVIANFINEHFDYRGIADIIDIVRGAILDGLFSDFLDYDNSYLSLMYAVHKLAYNGLCPNQNSNERTSRFGPRDYLEVVGQVLRKAQNETILEKMFDEVFIHTLDKAADLWTIIVDANSTNPVCKTNKDECNRYIREIIEASPNRVKLIYQGQILRSAADFAKYYYENYHDKFIEAASRDGGNIKYLRDSKEELIDLARQLMEYKYSVGKHCANDKRTESHK